MKDHNSTTAGAPQSGSPDGQVGTDDLAAGTRTAQPAKAPAPRAHPRRTPRPAHLLMIMCIALPMSLHVDGVCRVLVAAHRRSRRWTVEDLELAGAPDRVALGRLLNRAFSTSDKADWPGAVIMDEEPPNDDAAPFVLSAAPHLPPPRTAPDLGWHIAAVAALQPDPDRPITRARAQRLVYGVFNSYRGTRIEGRRPARQAARSTVPGIGNARPPRSADLAEHLLMLGFGPSAAMDPYRDLARSAEIDATGPDTDDVPTDEEPRP